MRHALAVLLVMLATSTTLAAPEVLRDGANHHLGDDSFVARFGRAPTIADPNALRMRVHLEYVHDLLSARAATSPALEGRRAELLGYLRDYIAKGTTPRNTYVAHRNPVFIDRDGNICAVGYLIERSVGRALPEKIAAEHRLDYLEDIAVAMPEVARWVATSGFALDELASIQPGYPGPEVMHVAGWLTGKPKDSWQQPIGIELPKDGPYRDDSGMQGTFARRQMTGKWSLTVEAKVLGSGTFANGAGTWTSFRADGTKLAVGPFVRSHAHGTWKIFHPSGRLAAIGTMRDGRRDGAWTLFYDTKANTKLAVGRFARGETVGTWRFFDDKTKLIATASGSAWGSLVLDIEPGTDGVRHEIHQGIPAESFRMDGLYRGGDRLYVTHAGAIYDGNANRLEKVGGAWQARSCKWSAARKRSAAKGDAVGLHKSLLAVKYGGGEDNCDGAPVALDAARAKRYEAIFASRSRIHAPIPAFDVDPRPRTAKRDDTEKEAAPVSGVDNEADFATYLANGMRWYIEWPMVDGTFVALYQTLPGSHRGMFEL